MGRLTKMSQGQEESREVGDSRCVTKGQRNSCSINNKSCHQKTNVDVLVKHHKRPYITNGRPNTRMKTFMEDIVV